MFHPTAIGVALLIASFLMFVLKILTKLMERNLQVFSIKELWGLEWIDKIPFYLGQQAMTYISTASLSSVFLVTGLLFIALGMFKKH